MAKAKGQNGEMKKFDTGHITRYPVRSGLYITAAQNDLLEVYKEAGQASALMRLALDVALALIGDQPLAVAARVLVAARIEASDVRALAEEMEGENERENHSQ